jgi:hypothetical protein
MGTAATWVGGTMALYFWLFFDIGVPTGGMQYVNVLADCLPCDFLYASVSFGRFRVFPTVGEA